MTTDSAAKTIRLIADAAEREYKVTVMPGDTLNDLFEQANLDVNQYKVLKPDNTPFSLTENIYAQVDENGKLHILMKSTVGSSLEGWIRSTPYVQKLLWRFGLTFRPLVRVTTTSSTYAKDMGWKTRPLQDGVLHYGYYYAVRKRWQGAVVEKDGKLQFKIYDPPMSVIRGTEWEGCFHAISKDGWYYIGFKPHMPAKDLSGGVAEINRVLTVCLNRASRRNK